LNESSSSVYCKPCEYGYYSPSDNWSDEMHMCERHRDCSLPGIVCLSIDLSLDSTARFIYIDVSTVITPRSCIVCLSVCPSVCASHAVLCQNG